MELSFLEAGIPLQKTFYQENNTIQSTSYPMVRNFTSHTYENINSLQEMYDLIVEHAEQGHCLVKGHLQRELVNESRANATIASTMTQWICLDIDGVGDGSSATVESLLKDLGLSNYSYIVQYSSKMGVVPSAGLSAHVFMMLDTEVLPESIKTWLKHANLTIPSLAADIRLTRDKNQLRWPLDITVCQNDKLIYITPPSTRGALKDGFASLGLGERIQYVQKRKTSKIKDPNKLPISVLGLDALDGNVVREEIANKINSLRVLEGIPERTFATKLYRGETVDASPTSALVTGIREDRGFVYLNLNGGDSWAYFHPLDNPHIIRNFKGQEAFATKDLLPDYYESAKERTKEIQQQEKADLERNTLERNKESYDQLLEVASEKKDGYSVFVANNPDNDSYYTIQYWHAQDRLELRKRGSRQKLIDFMAQHMQPEPSYIPDWTFEFAFNNSAIFDARNQWVNLYTPTQYMKDAHEYLSTSPKPNSTALPPTIERVIHHVLGEDQQVIEDFINWFAYLVQFREPPRSAWIIQGRQGTGKGVLFNNILMPIIGTEYCTPTSVQALETQFNGWLKNCLLALVDESKTDNISDGAEVLERMKVYVKEPYVQLRAMRQDHQKSPIFTSFIITSNSRNQGWKLEETDRRFHVAPYQEKFLDLDADDLDLIEQELPQFVKHVMEHQVDKRTAITPRDSEHKQMMKHVSRTAIDSVSQAVNTGDMEFFLDHAPLDIKAAMHDPAKSAQSSAYVKFIQGAVDWYQDGTQKTYKVHRDVLRIVLDYLVGNVPDSPNKLTSYLKHHELMVKQLRIDNVRTQGIEMIPVVTDEFVTDWHAYMAGPTQKQQLNKSDKVSVMERAKASGFTNKTTKRKSQ